MTSLTSSITLFNRTCYARVLTWSILMLWKFLCPVWVLFSIWIIRFLEWASLIDHPLHAFLNLALTKFNLRLEWGLFFLLGRQWFKRDLLFLYFSLITLFDFSWLLYASKFYRDLLWTRFIINSLVRHRSLWTGHWSLWTSETLTISICLPLSWLTCSLRLNLPLNSVASESIYVISNNVHVCKILIIISIDELAWVVTCTCRLFEEQQFRLFVPWCFYEILNFLIMIVQMQSLYLRAAACWAMQGRID